MNILFDNLESLIDAPNGIEKGRELILQLAIQGKLTEQDPKDEPASELLKKIKKEKEKLLAEGKIKKQNELPPISDEEKSFELPKGWEWSKMDDLGSSNIGLTYSPNDISDSGLPVLRSNNIQNGNIVLNDLVRVNKEVSENVLVHKNDLLICARNGSRRLVGKCALINELSDRMAFGAFMAIFRSKFNSYIKLFLESPLYRSKLEGVETTTINQITQGNLRGTVVPLPPLNEQKRIVEKVNSLMALLDELEEKRERRNQKRIKLNNASLEKLLTSKDDEEQKTNWKRIEENFSTLYSVPENVEKLKQAILQLAVQGKLVKQDPKDEPASELLKKINSSKLKFVKENKIRTPQKKLINSLLTELAVPASWEIVRLDDIINFITDFQANGSFASLRENVKYYSNEDFAVLVRLKDLRHDLKKSTDFVYTDKHGYEFLIKSSLTGGEILVANVGAGVGTTLVMPVINRKATLAPNMFKVILNDFIDKNYFLYFADSPLYWDWLNSFMKATAQPKMNKSEYASIIFPLPPLNEQKRIIEKVNELMSLCNTLEEKLTKKEATAEKLVGAVVNAVANKTNKPKDDEETKREKMKEIIEEIIKQHPKALEKLS
jgi:type I restriction enzyme S subunit